MYKNKHIITVLVLLSILSSCSDIEQEQNEITETLLSYNLDKDSTYTYNIKNEIVLNQEVGENSVIINQNMTLNALVKPITKSNNSSVNKITYNRITMSSGNQLFAIEFDSDNDNGRQAIYDNVRTLVGKTFTAHIKPTGSITSFEGSEQKKSNNQNNYSFNDNSIQKVLSHAFNIYPNKRVGIGSTWQRKVSSSIAFANVISKNVYQLVSIIDTIAHIEMRGRISTDKKPNDTLNVSLNGIQNGFYDLDIRTGQILNAKIEQQLAGDMDINGTQSPVDVDSKIYIIGQKERMVPKH